jgi:ribonuclease P protein component
MPKRFTLNKQQRLKSRKDIEQLFSEGKRFTVNPFRVFYLFPKETSNIQPSIFNLQFGVGVSTKNFKNAVDRNRIKEWRG